MLVMSCDWYIHVLKNVGAERGVDFLPAAEVSRSFVKQVTVARWQQVPHEDDRRTDWHEDEQLAGPAFIHILCTLKEYMKCLVSSEWWRNHFIFKKRSKETSPTVPHLDKPHRHKGHIVSTEHRADQHLLHPPVEIHLQILHLFTDEVRGEAAGVRRHGLDTI